MVRIFWIVGILFVSAGSIASAQSPSYDELNRQAEDAYCSRDFAKAVELSLSALELAKPDWTRTIDQVDRLAGASEKLRDYAAAERYYGQLLQILEQKFGKDSLNSAFAMEALARILARSNRLDEAEALFRRVPAARNKELAQFAKDIPNFQMPDVFQSRDHANIGFVALKRKQWQTAFDEYSQSILTIDTFGEQSDSRDSLLDLSSETNSGTFVGLARAAFELSKEPGQDATLLLEKSFEGLQRKWNTAAAEALRKAAARSQAPSRPAARKTQDREELLAALEAEREDLTQAWFAKRNADPIYKQGASAGVDADARYMAMGPEEREKIHALLAEMVGQCMKQNPPCNVEMNDVMARYDGKPAQARTQADQLHDREKQIPGFEEYDRRRIELEIEIGQLHAAGVTTSAVPQPESDANATPQLAAPQLTVSEVQGLLDEDEALLAYLIDEEEGFVWVITPTSATLSPLSIGNSELERAVNRMRSALEPPSAGGEKASAETARVSFPLTAAHEAYEKLLAPVRASIADKRHLLIVPTGLLTGLPFHVLLTEAPEPTLGELDGYRKAPWLARSYAISTLPSVDSLKSSRATRHAQAASAFLGFGDPNFDHTTPVASQRTRDVSAVATRCMRSRTAAVSKLNRLPDTGKELKDVASALGVAGDEILLGQAASEARVAEMSKSNVLSNYRVLYFATHGLVTGELRGLLEPALALTASQGDDGLLTSSEIAQLHLNADLVVLSACNTSSARRPGEETLSGLARGFLYAGARALIVSYWPADSFAASQLMSKTFARLAADPKGGYAEALKQGMLELINQGDIVGAHPGYWAPFVIVGDGRNLTR
jgi:CHAT domain-containing protein